MAILIDGFTDSLDAILAAEAGNPDVDSKGNVKPIKWKFTPEAAKEGGSIASAEAGGWKYEVQVLKCRVNAVRVKDVARTPEELVKTSPVVRQEDTQTPGFMEKNVEAVQPTKSPQIKDNDSKFWKRHR